MARYYRKRWGRFRRFKRRTYRRRFKKTRRVYRKRSLVSKAKKFIRRRLKEIKRTPYGDLRIKYETGQFTKRFQQTFTFDITWNQFNTGLGHFISDCTLSYIMNQNDLDDLKGDWYSWKPLAFSISFKYVSSYNLYLRTDNEAALTNYYWQSPNPGNVAGLWAGWFPYSIQQNDCANLDVDTDSAGSNNLTKILETGRYKRLKFNGKPVTWTWVNSDGYKGVYTAIGNSDIATLTSVAWAGTMPTNNEIHGWDIMLLHRNKYHNSVNNPMSMRFQCVVNAVISLRNRRPVN